MSLINKTSSLWFWSICPPLCGRQPRCRSVNVLHPYSHTRHCSFIVFKLWQHKALQEGVTGFHPLFQLHFPVCNFFPIEQSFISWSYFFLLRIRKGISTSQSQGTSIRWFFNLMRKWGKWEFLEKIRKVGFLVWLGFFWVLGFFSAGVLVGFLWVLWVLFVHLVLGFFPAAVFCAAEAHFRL